MTTCVNLFPATSSHVDAVATSVAYLQSSQGWDEQSFRWTYGPLKQIPAEGWLDSIKCTTGYRRAACDHRIPFP